MLSERFTCDEISDRLALVADGEHVFGPSERLHVEACIRCQAEQAQYRRLMKAMRNLRDTPAVVDSTVELEILQRIDGLDRRFASRARSRAAAALGGLAAGAAAAAGVIVLASRHRRVARLAS